MGTHPGLGFTDSDTSQGLAFTTTCLISAQNLPAAGPPCRTQLSSQVGVVRAYESPEESQIRTQLSTQLETIQAYESPADSQIRAQLSTQVGMNTSSESDQGSAFNSGGYEYQE